MCKPGRLLVVVALATFVAIAAGASPENNWRKRAYTEAADADRVTTLPGAPITSFGIFAGYVTVSESRGAALYYAFVEAEEPNDKPVVLWLNGGPGCSSIGGGFMSEIGPFYPTPGSAALEINPYAWNRVANILFLDSPAKVGWSYSNSSADAVVGDARTAADARLFLLRWLERFPQYASSEIYLSGESYGGHYIPNLAAAILDGNAAAASAAAASPGGAGAGRQGAGGEGGDGYIPLKGFLVGNPWTDAAIDNKGALDFWYTHALVSAEAHAAIHATCDFSVIGPLSRGAHAVVLGQQAQAEGGDQGALRTGVGEGSADDSKQGSCSYWLDRVFAEQGSINIYDIYADICLEQQQASSQGEQVLGRRQPRAGSGSSTGSASASASARRRYMGALLGELRGGGAEVLGAAPGGLRHPGRVPRYDPCVDDEVEVYLNRPEVQAALHANQTVKLPGPWSDCTSSIYYSRSDLLASMLPVYKQLLGSDLRIWVYSGDVDGIVPVLGTRLWVESLALPVTIPWRPWKSGSGQVAGWRIDYQGLTFATVRNAGHMVPYVQPERALHLLASFLGTRPAPSLRVATS